MEFPAQFARASLKACRQCEDTRAFKQFPAQFARASLKGLHDVRVQIRRVQFPAQFCAGLIEGGAECAFEHGSEGNFPRNLRGPH